MPPKPHPVLRAYRPEDAPLVAAFSAEASARDATLHRMSEQSWRAYADWLFSQPGGAAQVGEEEGRIVATAYSSLLEGDAGRRFRIIVHPDQRRRGIGSHLLAWVRELNSSRGLPLEASCPNSWIKGGSFLEHRGFIIVHRGLELAFEGEKLCESAPPEGVTIRAGAGSGDLQAWEQLHNEVYTGIVGFFGMRPGDGARLAREEGFDLRLADHGGHVVGFCHTKRDDTGGGRIESLGVTQVSRGMGVGRALLDSGMAELHAKGLLTIRLGVDAANIAALALYRSVGFAEVGRTYVYRSERK